MGLMFSRTLLGHGEIPHDADFSVTHHAVEVDVRIEVAPTAGQTFALASKGGLDATTAANFWLAYRNNGGTFELVAGFWDATSGSAKTTAGTAELVVGRWYKVAYNWNNTTKVLNLYYAARAYPTQPTPISTLTLVATGTHASAVPATNTQKVRIGCDTDAAGALQNGASVSVSEVRINNQTISSTTMEERAIYRQQGLAASLVGCWSLDERSGTTSRDLTAVGRVVAGGNDLTLKNGAMWTDDPADLLYGKGWGKPNAAGLARITPPVAIIGGPSHTRRQGVTITASSEASGYSASRLRSPRKTTTTRTANASGAKTWTFDFGQPVPISAVLVRGHNLTSAAVIKVMLNTADSWGSPAVDRGMPPTSQDMVVLLRYPWLYRYARLEVTDTGNPAGYLEIGGIEWLPVYELPQPMDAGRSSVEIHDDSTAVSMLHGHRVDRSLAKTEDWQVELPDLRRRQADYVRGILTEAGGGELMWLCPDARRNLLGGVSGYFTALGSDSQADPPWTRTAIGGVAMESDR